jgi:CHAD domain-containing protein
MRDNAMRDFARLQTAILLRRFAYQLGNAAKSLNPDAIHDLRVAIRRLSVCLRVFARFYPGRSAKRVRRQLQGLMELSGEVRNRDIACELLGKAGIPAKLVIVTRLRDERRKASNRLSREIRLWKNRGFSRKWRTRLEL